MADILWKYATSGQYYAPLLLASTQNFASTSTVTLASTDATIIKDGSTWRALTNTPTAIAMGSKATFQIIWSASEATAKQTIIQIKDETGALVQDQQINIVTYGSSLAQHAFNLNQAIENSTMGAVVTVTSDVTGSVGSIASTAALPANLVQAKDSTANADNWVTNIDSAISSRMSSTKSVLGSTVGAQLSSTAIDLIWDEVITNTVHNDANSAGKRLRQAAEGHIIVNEGTARAGSSNTIQLSTSADGATDDIYNSAYITILAGIGVGETNFIISYDSGTKTATMAHDWVVTPTAASEYMLTQSAMANIHAIEDSHTVADNLEADYDGTGYNKSNSAIGTASNVATEINDALFVDATSESTGLGGSLGNKVSATYERFFNHHQQDSSTQVVMKSGSTLIPKFVMTVTNTTTLQTVQEATTV